MQTAFSASSLICINQARLWTLLNKGYTITDQFSFEADDSIDRIDSSTLKILKILNFDVCTPPEIIFNHYIASELQTIVFLQLSCR